MPGVQLADVLTRYSYCNWERCHFTTIFSWCYIHVFSCFLLLSLQSPLEVLCIAVLVIELKSREPVRLVRLTTSKLQLKPTRKSWLPYPGHQSTLTVRSLERSGWLNTPSSPLKHPVLQSTAMRILERRDWMNSYGSPLKHQQVNLQLPHPPLQVLVDIWLRPHLPLQVLVIFDLGSTLIVISVYYPDLWWRRQNSAWFRYFQVGSKVIDLHTVHKYYVWKFSCNKRFAVLRTHCRYHVPLTVKTSQPTCVLLKVFIYWLLC